RIDAIVGHRRETAAAIRAGAGAVGAWQEGAELSTWQFMPVALADSRRREALAASWQGEVETRVYYDPLHDLVPEYHAIGGLERTDDLFARILCLPMANDLSPAEAKTIAAGLARA
ncbi:MAG TPA: DegT/DnrJ/EryC1/StrS family aminotransferase, partial [Solirubrobacterales bacterium]|nr:DegT/DnrJ/EryC1/StrS family aminotransferase [Solirubrobacterales bacterium]